MPFEEDIDEFLDVTDGFARTAILGTTGVRGIFSEEYVQTDEIEGHAPTFLCEKSVAETALGGTIDHGDVVNFGGVLYQIRGVQPDESGKMVLLVLEKAT